MSNKPKQIVHEYNKYGYTNITPNYSNNPSGIYQMQQVEDSTYLEVYCSPDDVDDITRDINSHVDGVVGSIYTKVDTSGSIYVMEGDEEAAYESYVEALLAKLDPEGELYSLNVPRYNCTFSRKCDDTVKGSSTDRTQVSCSTVSELIEELFSKPYIHRLDNKLSYEQKVHLKVLSRRIQDMKGLEKETREVGVL